MSETDMDATLGEYKLGARNSSRDTERLQAIHDLAVENGAACGAAADNEPDDEVDAEKYVARFGGAVKALGGGRVGGYLVTFGGPGQTDAEGEYFDRQTDYGEIGKTPILYHHGLDSRLKRRRLGTGDLRTDEVGVWIEGQLSLRDEYERAVYGLVEAGKLGWSSGTAAHLVERESAGGATRIAAWPLGLDASLTPTPAEVRNRAVSLKTMTQPGGLPGAEQSAAGEGGDNQPIEHHPEEDTIMTEIDIQATITEAVDKAVKSVIAALPPTNTGGVQVVKAAEDKPFASLGEQLQAVKRFYVSGGLQYDPRLASLKATGLNEIVGADGGFLVQVDFATTLLQPMHETGPLTSRIRWLPVSTNANGITVNAVDETSRATGSRWGGVQGYRLAESATITASRPKFRQMNLRFKKYSVLTYATDELLQDSSALEAVIRQASAEELSFMANDDIMNGTGAAGPYGILTSAALVSQAKETGQAAATVVAENVMKMWQRLYSRGKANAVWLINPDVFGQLPAMKIGDTPIFMPPGGVTGLPYGTIFGRPVVECEFCATLGTVGDIILADLGEYIGIERQVAGAVSPHVAFTTDENVFRFVYRIDGQPSWSSAVTPYKGSSTVSPFVALATRS